MRSGPKGHFYQSLSPSLSPVGSSLLRREPRAASFSCFGSRVIRIPIATRPLVLLTSPHLWGRWQEKEGGAGSSLKLLPLYSSFQSLRNYSIIPHWHPIHSDYTPSCRRRTSLPGSPIRSDAYSSIRHPARRACPAQCSRLKAQGPTCPHIPLIPFSTLSAG